MQRAAGQGAAAGRQGQVFTCDQVQGAVGGCRRAGQVQAAPGVQACPLVAAHDAGHLQIARSRNARLVRGIQLRRGADAQIAAGAEIQRTVGAQLAVHARIAHRLEFRARGGHQNAAQRQIAPGIGLHALALQLAARAQQQVVAALELQRPAIGKRIAVHAQVV